MKASERTRQKWEREEHGSVLEGEENGKIRCGEKREWKESEWSE